MCLKSNMWDKRPDIEHATSLTEVAEQTLMTAKVFTKAWEHIQLSALSESPRTTASPWQQNNNHRKAQASYLVEGPLHHIAQWTVNSGKTCGWQDSTKANSTQDMMKWVRLFLCSTTESLQVQTDCIQKL